RTWRSLKKISVSLPAAAAAAMVLCGSFVAANSGLPHRIPAAVLSVAEGALDRSEHRSECHRPGALRGALKDVGIGGSCVLGTPGVVPTSVIWGDSHAVELGDALSQAIARTGGSLLSVTYSS